MRRITTATIFALGLVTGLAAQVSDPLSQFPSPPIRYAPSCFWWWFGAPYSPVDVQSALDAMRAAGLGGFRIYPVYSFPGTSLPQGVRNAPYLSHEYVELVSHAVSYGKSIGLVPETLLTSGWPYGGPWIPPELGAGQLKFWTREVRGPLLVKEHVPGTWQAPERLLAVEAAEVSADGVDLTSLVDLTVRVSIDGTLEWNAPAGHWLVMTFVSGYTGMKVKRAAPGGEGLVMDHFSRRALAVHLQHAGDLQKRALAGALAVGVDSWEVYDSNWTPSLPEQFEKRRGYSLTRYLPAIFLSCGETGARVRYDFRQTISELAQENFFTPLAEWAHDNGLKLRAQAHGTPADVLDAYGAADLPEGETYGPEDRRATNVRDRKFATSAAHLFGRTQISSESFTWLRFPMFRVTLEQMKAEADAIYLDGVNQVNFHGVPFSPRWAPFPGFFFYASTFVSPDNTWWPYLRHLSDYLRRTNYLLQQGEPIADVAVYAPVEDAWSSALGTWTDLAGAIEQRLSGNGSASMLASLRDNGFDFDFINAHRLAAARFENGRLAIGPMRYAVVVLPSIETIDPDALDRLLKFCRAGGTVIADGRIPARSPGLLNADFDTARVKALAGELFPSGIRGWRGQRLIRGQSCGHGEAIFTPPDPARSLSPPTHVVARAVSLLMPADFELEQTEPSVGFIHRRAGARDIYFVANIGPVARLVHAHFRDGTGVPKLLDAETGAETAAPVVRSTSGRKDIALALRPWGSTFVVFEGSVERSLPPLMDDPGKEMNAMNLTGPWSLSRRGAERLNLEHLGDWAQLPGYRDYSGTASYETSFRVPPSWARPGAHVSLDLAEVKDIAEVTLNGIVAGTAWKHPYVIDVTRAIRPGPNRVEIRVTNLLINWMLAHEPELPAPYYRVRDYIPTPQPSGLLGPVTLRVVRGTQAGLERGVKPGSSR